MNDRATFLDDIAAQGVAVSPDEVLMTFSATLTPENVDPRAGPDLIVHPSAIPYGVKIAPDKLHPGWLLPGDIHVVFSARRADFRRVGTLDLDSHGKLRLNRKRIHVPTVDFVTLYRAPLRKDGLSPPS